jgi:bifunctional DNA-binding transcriptional regulator/antitoxin component of YhaV-PrlF toxin-antitoxin module
MARINVKFKDKNNIPKLRRTLKELESYVVEVGVFSSDDNQEPSYVMIANVHEFGVTIQKEKGSITIPERSFMRSTFDMKSGDWLEFVKRQLKLVINFKIEPKILWERLGALMVADIQEAITDLDTPPNAPATIAKKGSSNPLIDTGGLRGRITYRVVKV